MDTYYDGTKLLQMADINGNKPEIFMVDSNRTDGKTTYFIKKLVDDFLNFNHKFAVLFRFTNELKEAADTIFKDVSKLFYPNMTFDSCFKDFYTLLTIDEVHCGYALAINAADNIKKRSHLFSDIDQYFMDEFQSESNKYCGDEVTKFMSIHTSIARGNGKQTRYVPVYMASNTVTLLNPYYTAMGISDRLRANTKFLRGPGFVLEKHFNEHAAKKLKASGFMQAFAKERYADYAASQIYLLDNTAFVGTPQGRSEYLCTIRVDGKDYGIRSYPDFGIVHCSDRPDSTFRIRIAATTEDHNVNYVMLKKYDFMISNLRFLFERGCFRFKNLQCKNAILKTLSY